MAITGASGAPYAIRLLETLLADGRAQIKCGRNASHLRTTPADDYPPVGAAGERPTGSRDPYGLRRAAQGIVKILNDLLMEEEKIDTGVRQQIASQKRVIPEGSGEWDILYRKYYNEEVKKLGV